jgi:hypothetical protein
MVTTENCLNGANTIAENFCPKCGQKTTARRYSLKHFVEHDLIHGICHVDNGILFTIRELFTRPGHSIREFINGKRVGYFNFVTLLLLILGISHFLGEYAQVKISDLIPDSADFNFDGITDFSIFESSYAGPNTSSLYFLYNPKTKKYFESGFSGTSLQFDEKGKRIIETNQCCAGSSVTTAEYKVIKNKMILEKERCFKWNDKKQALVEQKVSKCR